MPQRDRRAFHDRSDSDRELAALPELSAVRATPQPARAPVAVAVAHLLHVDATALRAARRLAPSLTLKELDGRLLVGARQWELREHLGRSRSYLTISHRNIILGAQ